MSAPTVLVGGFAYRLNAAGRMEHVAAQRMSITGRRWVAVTEATEENERAALALLVLHGGPEAAISDVPAIDRVTTVRSDLSSPGFYPQPRLSTSPSALRRSEEFANTLQRLGRKRNEGPDAREVAAAKGLKIWNGGMLASGLLGHGKADEMRFSHNHSVKLYACAKSRAEVVRMVAAAGGDTRGLETVVKRWTEGAWGDNMAGIEPEPGLWLLIRGDKPVRVWPKEKANA